jgi:hypothetical protein
VASLSGLKNLSNFFDFLFLSLIARIEYIVSPNSTDLRLFNANDSAARRAIGTHSIACYQADHVVSRQWANALFSVGANGILYFSA